MLTYAVILFAITAVGGLILASYVLRGQLTPWGLSLLHASLGAVGLVLILLTIAEGTAPMVMIALVILLIAALGGFHLASLHARETVAPSKTVFIHAGAAVVGFLVLCTATFGLL